MNLEGQTLQSALDGIYHNPEPLFFTLLLLSIAVGTLIVYYSMLRRRTTQHRPKAFDSFRQAKITFDRNLKILLADDKEVEMPYRPVADKLPPLRGDADSSEPAHAEKKQ